MEYAGTLMVMVMPDGISITCDVEIPSAETANRLGELLRKAVVLVLMSELALVPEKAVYHAAN